MIYLPYNRKRQEIIKVKFSLIAGDVSLVIEEK